jgi:ABC-type phosphate transport system ATPase subunit
MAYLPQETYLFDMSVIKNITITMGKDKNLESRGRKILENVNMNGFADSSARSLSGGETQRVAVARVLALEKQLVLLDEPAASIDISSSTLVENLIVKTNQETGSTIIFTTHNPSQAARIANEVIIMWEGKIIEKGRPLEIFNFPHRDETKEFLRNWRI